MEIIGLMTTDPRKVLRDNGTIKCIKFYIDYHGEQIRVYASPDVARAAFQAGAKRGKGVKVTGTVKEGRFERSLYADTMETAVTDDPIPPGWGAVEPLVPFEGGLGCTE